MRTTLWVVSVALAAAVACRREEPRPRESPPGAVFTASGAQSANPVPSVSASSFPAAPDAPEDPAKRAVRAWSDALDRHDLRALERVYDASVVFYGQPRSRTAVLAAKRAAFEKQRSFRQELVGDIALAAAADGRVTATFTKRSGDDAAFSVATATLVLAPSPQGYVVVEEADAASLRRRTSPPAACEAKATEVVNELPEVKRATADAMDDAEQSDGGAHFGGVGPNEDGEGGITFSLGVHTDERFEARVVASVAKDGALSVTVLGSDVAVPAAVRRAVREACRH